MPQLSPRAQQIIPQLQLDARCPLTVVAKRLKMKVHTVRYEIQRLIENRIIYPYMLINPAALGQHEVDLFCTLADRRQGDLSKLIKALERAPGLFVLNLTGGQYQLGFELVVTRLEAVTTFLEQLSSRYGLRLAEKSIATCLTWTLYYRKYLSKIRPLISEFVVSATDQRVELGALDRNILLALGANPLASMRDLAKTIGSPESTVTTHVRALQSSGVIIGFGLSIDAADINMHSYRFIISLRDFSASIRQKLYLFCRDHPHVLSISESLGGWDYSVRVEVHEPLDALRISDELHFSVAGAIESLHVVPLLKEVVVSRDNLAIK